MAELGILKLASGDAAGARSAITEALDIDVRNNYDSLALHRVYEAQVQLQQDNPNLQRIIKELEAVYAFALERQVYPAAAMATQELAKAYIRNGNADNAIDLLTHALAGRAFGKGGSVQQSPSFQAAVNLPLHRAVFLAVLAGGYVSLGRQREALNTWVELYEFAKQAGFREAEAGSALEIARSNQALGNEDEAIKFFGMAADRWRQLRYPLQLQQSLAPLADLLVKRGDHAGVIHVCLELAKLAEQNKNPILRIIALTYLAQGYASVNRTSDASTTYSEAEQGILDAFSDPTVDPQALSDRAVGFFLVYADFLRSQRNGAGALLALERAMFAADNEKHVTLREPLLQMATSIADLLALRSEAEQAYSNKNYSLALLCYELQRTLLTFESKWANSNRDVQEGQQIDQKLLELAIELAKTDAGASALADNLLTVGPIAGLAERVGYDLLMRYYLSKQDPKTAFRFGKPALTFINAHQEKPLPPDVQALCLYAWAAFGAGEAATAQNAIRNCESQANKLEPPDPHFSDQVARLKSAILAFSDPASAQDALKALLGRTSDEAAIHSELAGTFARQGKRTEAVREWESAISLFAGRHDPVQEARGRLDLAQFLLQSRMSSDASRVLEELAICRKLFTAARDTTGLVETDLALANFYVHATDEQHAFRHLKSAKDQAATVNDTSLRASVASGEGAALSEFRHYRESLSAYSQAALLYHESGDFGSEASELYFAANQLRQLGRIDEAIQMYRKAQAIGDSGPYWLAQWWSRNGLAAAYDSTGDYDLVIKLYKEEIAIAEKEKQLLNLAMARRSLSWKLAEVGEWKLALEQAELAKNAAEELGDPEQQFDSLSLLMNILGDRRSSVKDIQKALSYYEIVSKLAATEKNLELATLGDVLAELYWQSGKYQEGWQSADRAAHYYKRNHDAYTEAHALMARSEAERRLKDYPAAEKSLIDAKRAASGIHDLYTTGRLCYTEAGLARSEGRLQDAARLYDQTITILNKLKGRVQKAQETTKLAESYSFVFDEAIEALHALYASNVTPSERIYTATRALEISEENKSKEFLKSWGTVFARELRRTLPSALQERERVLVARISELTAELENPGQEPTAPSSSKRLRDDLAKAKRDIDEFGAELWKQFPNYASIRFPRAVATAAIPLKDAETLVSFRVTDLGTFVWFVERSENGNFVRSFYRVPQDRSWLRQRVAHIRDVFNHAEPTQFQPAISQEIFGALFPGEHAAEILGAKRVIAIPDDCLFLLPLEVLSPSGTAGIYPLLDVPVTYFPSVSALALARGIKSKQDWDAELLAIGDPITTDEKPVSDPDPSLREKEAELRQRGLSLDPLPGTEREIKEIAKLFADSTKTDVRLGPAATKSGLLHTDLSRYRFLHFATHGLLPTESNLLEPALVFSRDQSGDSFLQLSEVLNLRLKAESVVLSACNTGSGDITKAEGVANLGRGFLLAGSSTAVVSLWQVSDESTALLMKHYYKGVLSGKAKPDALGAARAAVFRAGYENPFFWAAFVLMSD